MQVLALTFIPLFSVCLWLTVQCYLNLNFLEKEQIRCDNLAIYVGRRDREFLNLFEKERRALELVENFHHTLHGATDPRLKAIDLSLEQLLRKKTQDTENRLKTLWHKNNLKIQSIFIENSGSKLTSRDENFPILWRRCSRCLGPFKPVIVKPFSTRRYQVISNSHPFTSSIIKWKFGTLWNYQME